MILASLSNDVAIGNINRHTIDGTPAQYQQQREIRLILTES